MKKQPNQVLNDLIECHVDDHLALNIYFRCVKKKSLAKLNPGCFSAAT